MDKSKRCSCNDPWRFDEKKMKGEIKTLQDSIDHVWANLSKKVSMSVFALVLTLMSTTLSAIVWASYDTTKNTYQLVSKIDKDIELLKLQQKYGKEKHDTRKFAVQN